MWRWLVIVMGGVLVSALAPHGVQAQPPPPKAPPPGAAEPPPEQVECPELVKNMLVDASEVKGGVVLEVTTRKPAEVAEVRREVEKLISLHREQEKELRKELDKNPQAEDIPLISVRARDIKSGIRVELRPEKSEHVEPLRRAAEEFERAWSALDCAP